MQAPTTSANIKSTTTSTATSSSSYIKHQDSLPSATSTTSAKVPINIGTTNKKTGPPAATGANNIRCQTSDASDEINEISKKISEHADAIYRTWKSHGLAPTELLEFYTNAAAAENTVAAAAAAVAAAGDFFVGSKVVGVEDTNSLQSLVNNFVSKDKEQRGVKASSNTSIKGPKGSITNTNTKISHTPDTLAMGTENGSGSMATKKLVQKNPNTTVTSPLKSNVKTGTKSALTPTTTKTATPATTTKKCNVANDANVVATTAESAKMQIDNININKTAVKNQNDNQTAIKSMKITKNQLQQQQNAQRKSNDKLNTSQRASKEIASAPKTALSLTTTTTPKALSSSAPLSSSSPPTVSPAHVDNLTTGKNGILAGTRPRSPLDINFNLELNNLDDLKNLTHIQTENLKMIKELLQAGGTSNNNNASQAHDAGANKILKGNAMPKATTTTSVKTKSPSIASDKSNKALKCIEMPNSDTSSSATSPPNAISPSSPHTVNKRNVMLNEANNNVAIEYENNIDHIDSIAITELPQAHAMKLKAADVVKSKLNTSLTPTTAGTTKTTQKLTKSSCSNSGRTIKEKNRERSPSAASTAITATREPATAKATTPATATSHVTEALTAPATVTPTTAAAASVMELARNNMPAPTKLSSTSPATTTKFSNSNSSRSAAATAASATQLSNGQHDKYLGRPILTRGSVAERVLMFEKCPDVRNSFLNIKRPDPADAPPKSLLKAKLHATPPSPQVEQNSLQREIRNTKSVYIPRFYFPHGKPQPTIALERTLRGILSAFDSFPNNQVTKDELPRILKLCGLPFYWRMPVMVFCQQGNSGLVERQRYVEFWKQMNVYCHDAASRFVYILSRGQRFRSYIQPEDLVPLVQDVVDTHPGLAFLKEATEFHSRYVHTVIARIFYSVNRSWSGRITISELKKSDLLEIITLLEEEDDINQIMAFFSYEHFYVIYCKFWELDKDHDLLINQDDLAKHSDHALSTRIVERIFSGCVTRNDNKKNPNDEPKMSYADFVWFLLSEEDKHTPTAIEYWFRCMDIDGDGVLSMYELEYFYEEQQQRMESIGIETLSFEDCLCQMLDMIKPQRRDSVSLGDLKRCKMTHVFFDTFFNLEKYLDHEQRDPFASQRDEYPSDWDRFAAQEYELLISEEND